MDAAFSPDSQVIALYGEGYTYSMIRFEPVYMVGLPEWSRRTDCSWSAIIFYLAIEPTFGQFCRKEVQHHDSKNDWQVWNRQWRKTQQSS